MTRAQLPALGYLYVALALPALLLGVGHERRGLGALHGRGVLLLLVPREPARLVIRFDPRRLLRSVVVMGGAAFIALQGAALLLADPRFAAPSSAAAAAVIVSSSLAALRARKIPKWFGRAGVAGGIAVLGVGMVEGAADWTFAGRRGVRLVARLHGVGRRNRDLSPAALIASYSASVSSISSTQPEAPHSQANASGSSGSVIGASDSR